MAVEVTVEHPDALAPGARIEAYEVDSVLAVSDAGIRYSCRDGDDRFALFECFPTALVRRQDDGVVPHTTTASAAFATTLDEFLRDAGNAVSFRHPGVVPLHRTFRANGTVYAVMDYVEGETLASVFAREGRLSPERLETLTNGLLVSLGALHGASLMHLGVDPGEIVMTDTEQPVVLASTLVRRSAGGSRHAFPEVRQQRRTVAFTTSPYAAIELYTKGGQIGPWTDLYGLAATLYHCVMGEAPPPALDRVLHDDLPVVSSGATADGGAGILAAIDASLKVHPTERPRSVDGWRIVSQGRSAPARPGQIGARGGASTAAGEGRSYRPRWALAALGLVAVTAVISYVDTGVLRDGDDPPALEVAAAGTVPEAEEAPNGGAAPDTSRGTADGGSGPDPSAEEAVTVAGETDVGDVTAGELEEATVAQLPGEPERTDGLPVTSVADAGGATEAEVVDGDDAAEPAVSPVALLVETVPRGVEVWLAGERVGLTPLQIEGLSPGVRDISLRHPLYETIDLLEQDFAPGRQLQVERRLARASGNLLVTTDPPGAWISWRGERLADATPTTVEGLPAGPLELVIGASGHVARTVSVEVPRDDTGAFEWSLERAFGSLTLDLAPPDAAATVLGEDGGAYAAGMALPEGQHRIEVRHPDYRSQTALVAVAGDTRAAVVLERLQACGLRVRSTPPALRYPVVRTFRGGRRDLGNANILVAFTIREDGTVAGDSVVVDVDRSALDDADNLELFSGAAMDAVRSYEFDFGEGPCTKRQRASLMIRFLASEG